MPRNANLQGSLAMVAVALMLAVCVAYKDTTMANNSTNNSTNNSGKGSKGSTALATTQGTTPVAQAPHMHPVPTQPSTQPAANWQLVGRPSTAKSATNGVGPAPRQGTVGYAALACIAAAGKQGATLAALQAAVTAVGLRGKHPIMPLLTWLAKNRGYTFTCSNGYITLG